MPLTESQDTIASDLHRFRVLACGRKFGKTTLSKEEIKGAALLHDGWRILYVAPTLGDARRLLWDKLRNDLLPAIVKENDTRLELKVRTVHGGTSDIFLGSWELVQNYRGDEFDFIIFDEVQDYRNFWVGWQEAMRPTLTPRQGTALFMGTPKGFTHFYDLFNLHYKDGDYACFRYSTYDNPHIPRGEIEKAKQELPEDRFAQEYLADFRKSQGLVFKEFDRESHVYTTMVRGYSEYLAGVDFGYNNPAAVLDVVVKDGCYYVMHELYRSAMTDADTADYVASRGYNKVYPDPESASGIEEMRRKKVNVRDVKKGKDSIKHGIDAVRELFKQNRLFIHSSCVNLVSELESYSYADESPLRNADDNPIDKNNHCCDALRYVVMSHTMSKPIPPHRFYDKTLEIWRK